MQLICQDSCSNLKFKYMHIQKSFLDLVSVLHFLKQQECHCVGQRLFYQPGSKSSKSLSCLYQHLQLPSYSCSTQLVLSDDVAL